LDIRSNTRTGLTGTMPMLSGAVIGGPGLFAKSAFSC
jgi:hypothetical protein